MATLLLSAVGTMIGGPIGGVIGAMAGRQVDSMVLGGRGTREGARLTELAVTTSSYGSPVPRQFGRTRVAGQIIWATDLVEHKEKQGNGKGKPSTISYSYTASLAVALSSRPIRGIGRIWADGKLLRGSAGDLKAGGEFRLHTGLGDQPADLLLAAKEGADRCPAYRGLAYAVFEDLQLGDFGNRIPALSFEVIADDSALSLLQLMDGAVARCDADIALAGLSGLSMEGAVADTLAALDPLFPVDCDACGELLTFRPDRRQPAPILLSEASVSTTTDAFGGKAGYARRRGAVSQQPPEMLRYYDIDRDYQPGVQRATGRPQPGQPRTMELPATLDAQAARRLIESAANRMDWERQLANWRVTQFDPQVRPGAIVTLPGLAGRWKVREWEWHGEGIDLTLSRQAPEVGAALAVADPGRAAQAPDEEMAASALVAFELPWDGNPASPVPLLLAATSSQTLAWTGASLYVDQGDGALLPLGPAGRGRAVIGTSVDTLSSASPLLFDRERSVLIALIATDMNLADATMRQLAMGANRALLGQEIIQFSSAAPQGNGVWKLSGLWRGRGGTESAVENHASGEAFVLLDGTGTALDPQEIGSAPATQIAAVGLGDQAPVVSSIHMRGIGFAPPSPVHGRAVIRADGGVTIGWVRRARGAWQWNDGVETPLNEQVEFYQVIYGSLASVLAQWETATSQLSLSQAEFSALRTLAPDGSFMVRQRGDRAVSEPLTIAIA